MASLSPISVLSASIDLPRKVEAFPADSERIYDPEPDVGAHWLSKADFEASYQVFGQMAVALA